MLVIQFVCSIVGWLVRSLTYPATGCTGWLAGERAFNIAAAYRALAKDVLGICPGEYVPQLKPIAQSTQDYDKTKTTRWAGQSPT